MTSPAPTHPGPGSTASARRWATSKAARRPQPRAAGTSARPRPTATQRKRCQPEPTPGGMLYVSDRHDHYAHGLGSRTTWLSLLSIPIGS